MPGANASMPFAACRRRGRDFFWSNMLQLWSDEWNMWGKVTQIGKCVQFANWKLWPIYIDPFKVPFGLIYRCWQWRFSVANCKITRGYGKLGHQSCQLHPVPPNCHFNLEKPGKSNDESVVINIWSSRKWPIMWWKHRSSMICCGFPDIFRPKSNGNQAFLNPRPAWIST